ncbi:VanZ family protein [Bacillus piscicola]|uniref:VanZ family protein n=1 Tax=Bacillus piscicola TaxID=1632684 RepID=UPI001F0A02CC|nr:VanZ family protein [Bacillus piscicola]
MRHLEINSEKKKNTKRPALTKQVIFLILLFYLTIVLYVTLFAWNYGSSFGPVGPGGRNYNLTLFQSIYRIAVFSPDMRDPLRILGGNVVMFMPFGVLVSLLLKQTKKTFWIVAGLSMLLSAFIEINQFIFTYRVANVDDVLLNTVGGVVGACCIQFILFLKK